MPLKRINKKSFIEQLAESAKLSNDAKTGAVGAQQVRDLYNSENTEAAKNLAGQYFMANATGIMNAALMPEFATYGALGGLARLGAGTAGSAAGS